MFAMIANRSAATFSFPKLPMGDMNGNSSQITAYVALKKLAFPNRKPVNPLQPGLSAIDTPMDAD